MSLRQLHQAGLTLLCCVLLSLSSNSQKQTEGWESDQCSGIVSSVDTTTNKLTLRTKSQTDPKREVNLEFSFDSATKVSREDGTKGAPKDLKMGSVVACQTTRNQPRLDVIVMQSACTPSTCARTQCERNCRSVGCKCPKT